MRRQDRGFTLVELLVSMVMFVLVIVAATQVFTALLTQFKQQSKIEESQIEGLIGLELLRHDIEHAGYGLPWRLGGATYTEASIEGKTLWVDREFNDGPPAGESGNNARNADLGAGISLAPGAIRSEDGDSDILGGPTLNQSDVLVIKSMNVARNAVAHRWTRLDREDDKRDDLSGDTFEDSDRVVVIAPGGSDQTRRTLISETLPGGWSTRYDNTSNFAPVDQGLNFIVYGIKPQGDGSEPKRPFNRADYYIRRPDSNFPTRCAESTAPGNPSIGAGILYKGFISHSDGDDGLIPVELPLLDCVIDMQVVYRLDPGVIPAGVNEYESASYTNTLTAAQIRAQVREVRVYILAHEGQKDVSVNFQDGDSVVRVGPRDDELGAGTGRDLDLDGLIVDWQDYRWKVYTLVISPINFRS
jgi:prepilin-type N-terminal cleavage/methylation domain-containing protein